MKQYSSFFADILVHASIFCSVKPIYVLILCALQFKKTLLDVTDKRESHTMTHIERHSHVLVDFALGLFLTGLKQKEWDHENVTELESIFEMCTPLLKTAGADSTRTLVLKCAERIIQMKLDMPGMTAQLEAFAGQVQCCMALRSLLY